MTGRAARTILVENIGVLLTGDVRRPRTEATSLLIRDGRIAAVGAPEPADVTIDAAGDLVAPGLWDADHHVYFGDYTPAQDALGYLERTVQAGTTTVVSHGIIDLPAVNLDAQGATELATLAARSWVHDRPHGMTVHAAALVAAPGLREEDFRRLGGIGVGRIAFLEPVDSFAEVERYGRWARDAGMQVVARCGGPTLVREAASPGEALRAIRPDIAIKVNHAVQPLAAGDLDWLIDDTTCGLGVVLDGNLKLLRDIAGRLRERDQLDRLLPGTGMPSPAGVAPAGMPRLVAFLAALCDLPPEVAIACATGNAARSLAAPGGILEPGQPADLLIGEGTLDGLAAGNPLTPATLIIGGAVSRLGHPSRTAGPVAV